MAELTQQQLAEFNGKVGFIVKIINEAAATKMYFDGDVFVEGGRYPENDPKNSGVTLDQRGDKPIFHYFYGPKHSKGVTGAIGYKITFLDSGTSIYMYIGFDNQKEGPGIHGYYISLKETPDPEELDHAAHNAKEKGSSDFTFLARWQAHVEYENYVHSKTVQQINVWFRRKVQVAAN